jgi:hypothetical protein
MSFISIDITIILYGHSTAKHDIIFDVCKFFLHSCTVQFVNSHMLVC